LAGVLAESVLQRPTFLVAQFSDAREEFLHDRAVGKANIQSEESKVHDLL
jgi:hypothetical protein